MPMGVVNICVKWSMLELTGLLEDEDARVYFQRSKRHLALHPYQLNDLNRALREILGSKVNFYDTDLQGLVLAYKNPKLLDSLGGILHDSHFVHVDIEADFYIFRPEIGCTLKGIANKKAGNHLGVLVHKVFNVSILKADDCEEWLGDYVFVGQEVKFTVTHLDFKGKLPFIRGELVPDPTMGQIFYDRINTEEAERKPENLCVEGENSETSVKRRKKSKKMESTLDNGKDKDESNVNATANGIAESPDIEESSAYRDKTKKLHSSKKTEEKKMERKNDNLDSESSGDDRDNMKKHATSKKKLIDKEIDERNSALEDSTNVRDDKMKKSSTKKLLFEQIDGTNTSLDPLSSSDERGRIRSSVKILKKSSDNTYLVDPSSRKSSKNGVKVKSQKVQSRDDETDWGLDEKPKLLESIGSSRHKSKRIEETSKSQNLENTDDKTTDGIIGAEDPNDEIKSPVKRSKRNRISNSDEEDADVKPEIRAKKKKKKEDESAEEIDVKPDLRTKQKKKKKKKQDDKSAEEIDVKPDLRTKKKKKDDVESESTEKKSRSCDGEGNKIKLEHEEERKKRSKKPKANENGSDDESGRKDEELKSNKTEDEEAKRKRKKKFSAEAEHVAESQADVDEFEFIKPNLEAFRAPSVKCKRKRRKTVTGDEETSDSSADDNPENRDFFRDVRIKVESDLSDVDDFRLSKRRKKKVSAKQEEEIDGEKRVKRDERCDNVEIKQEPNMSDVEDAKTVKKKSKRKTNEENSYGNVKVKTEPDASDMEESITCKREPDESSK